MKLSVEKFGHTNFCNHPITIHRGTQSFDSYLQFEENKKSGTWWEKAPNNEDLPYYKMLQLPPSKKGKI